MDHFIYKKAIGNSGINGTVKLFLQTYYILLFCVLYRLAYNFINAVSPVEPEYIFFAKPLGFLNLPIEIHSVIFLFGLFFLSSICL